MDERKNNLFDSTSYQNLFSLVNEARNSQPARPAKQDKQSKPKVNDYTGKLSGHALLLGSDITQNPEIIYRQRCKRLGITTRQLQKAEKQLLNAELIKRLRIGKMVFLVPYSKLFDLLDVPCPYKRQVGLDHPFLVLITCRLLQKTPLVESVQTEVSLGDSSSTTDVLATLKDGKRIAYEVTVNASNVCSNAAKLQGKGIAEIVFLCRNYNLKENVWAKLRNAGFDPDFFSKLRCTIFSSLIRKTKGPKGGRK